MRLVLPRGVALLASFAVLNQNVVVGCDVVIIPSGGPTDHHPQHHYPLQNHHGVGALLRGGGGGGGGGGGIQDIDEYDEDDRRHVPVIGHGGNIGAEAEEI